MNTSNLHSQYALRSSRAPLLRGALLATALALTGMMATVAVAASASGRSTTDIEATYRTERQACLDGRTGQDLATCLKEAGAVRQQARTRGLDGGETPAQLLRNALARCDAVPTADRTDCQRLARGEGRSSGSVAAGGVYKEIITRTVMPVEAPPAPPAPIAPR